MHQFSLMPGNGKQAQQRAAGLVFRQTADIACYAGVPMNVRMYNCVLAACKVPPTQAVPVSFSHVLAPFTFTPP